jgi:phage replication initiation protein
MTKQQNQFNKIGSEMELPFVDWLSFTLPLSDKILVELSIFGAVERVSEKGYQFYSQAFWTVYGVLVAYTPEKPENKIYVSISAKSLKLISMVLTLDEIINFVIAREGKFTRIDLTLDDYNERLNLNKIHEKIKAGEIVTKFRNYSVYEGQVYSIIESGKIGKTTSKTIYLGDLKTSEIIVRIYDKGAKEEAPYPWVRVEFQLRKESADQYINQGTFINKTGEIKKGKDSKKISSGLKFSERSFPKLAYYYLRFLDPRKNKLGFLLHKRHWDTSPFWLNFLGVSEGQKIGLPKYETGLEDLRDWFLKQNSGAEFLLKKAFGEEFEKEKRKVGKEKFEKNEKYKKLLDLKNGN